MIIYHYLVVNRIKKIINLIIIKYFVFVFINPIFPAEKIAGKMGYKKQKNHIFNYNLINKNYSAKKFQYKYLQ